ncbi:MAG: phosphate signaling complex protein PhoU [Arenicella sp.]
MAEEQSTIGTHISKQYDLELEEIRSHVLKMGGLVEEQLTRVLSGIMEDDADQVGQVATEDYKVNQFEIEIDEECTRILARRQPTAGDLRLVVAVSKCIRDLERIGDETERMARMVQHSIEVETPEKYYKGFLAAGESIRKLLHNTLNVFARMDADTSVKLMREGYKIDKEFDAITKRLVDRMKKDPENIPNALDVMWSTRCLEKIGDHCINILENVVYQVKGQDVRHIHVDEIAETVKEG